MLLPQSICAIPLFLPLIAAYTCTDRPEVLPTLSECYFLIDALETLSVRPPYNVPMLWSRNTSDTITSNRLPKSYQLRTMVPNACSIFIDAIPSELNGNDTFHLTNVINVAEIVVERCLIRERRFGWGYPGMKDNIQVHVMRTSGLNSEMISRNESEITYISPELLDLRQD